MGLMFPWALLALFLLIPLVWSRKRFVKKTEVVQRKFGGQFQKARARKDNLVILGAVIVFVLSLTLVASRPYFASQQLIEGKTGDYILLDDVSKSKAARSRCKQPMPLARTKEINNALVSAMPEARFSIWRFAGLAFPLTPLLGKKNHWELHQAIDQGVYIEAVPSPGSDLPNALKEVARKKQTQSFWHDVEYVVLFTDGDLRGNNAESNLRQAIGKIKQANLRLVTVGVGSPDGNPVPILDEGNCTDKFYKVKGRTYFSFLNESILRDIAEKTGGQYFSAQETGKLISYLGGTLHDVPRESEYWEQKNEFGWYFLIPATISLFVLFWKRL